MGLRIIPPEAFTTTPWKNGGGITHEIAKLESAGRLVWRLSVAEVDTDGPFSRFDGLMRILTVIQGAGLTLASPEGELAAMPRQPVRFSGDLAVEGRRIDGPIRDLNVIFDPGMIDARVDYLHAGRSDPPRGTAGRTFALYGLAGEIGAGPAEVIAAGAAAMFTDPPELRFAAGAEGLLVTLDRRAAD